LFECQGYFLLILPRPLFDTLLDVGFFSIVNLFSQKQVDNLSSPMYDTCEKTRKERSGVSNRKTLQTTTCALFAAILCLLSPIALPLGGPVPFALQIFGVMLCAVTLPWSTALPAVLVYLLLGLFLPIFSRGNTGLTAIPGPTGGYIWSYLLMVPVIRLFRALRVRGRWVEYALALTGCTLAACICYLCGTVQFAMVTRTGFREALGVCVVPFIGFDLVKAAAAAVLGVELSRILHNIG
jgi:biotin transport system substrate-specific component